VVERRGATWCEVSWNIALPGILSAKVSCTILGHDVTLRIELTKTARYDPESIFVSFPFRSVEPRFLLETTDAVFVPEVEQLPDTSKDWYNVLHAVGVGAAEGGFLWGTLDAPLVALSEISTGEWSRRFNARSGHVYSWLMNNLYFTNFAAAQSGTATFRYIIRPTSTLGRAEVEAFGRELAQPVLIRAINAVPLLKSLPTVHTSTPGIDIIEQSPLDGDIVRVTLRSRLTRDVEAIAHWADLQCHTSQDGLTWSAPKTSTRVVVRAGSEAELYLQPSPPAQ
jgi:hypothetical protein